MRQRCASLDSRWAQPRDGTHAGKLWCVLVQQVAALVTLPLLFCILPMDQSLLFFLLASSGTANVTGALAHPRFLRHLMGAPHLPRQGTVALPSSDEYRRLSSQKFETAAHPERSSRSGTVTGGSRPGEKQGGGHASGNHVDALLDAAIAARYRTDSSAPLYT